MPRRICIESVSSVADTSFMNTANTDDGVETECPDCGVEYVERGRRRLCECNATEDDMEDMRLENMDEGRAFAMGDWS